MAEASGGARVRSWRRSVVTGLMAFVLAGAIAPAAEAAPAAPQREVAAPAAPQREVAAPAATYGPYRIMNDNSNQCLVVRGTAQWAPVVQTPCGYYRDQYWYFIVRPETNPSGPRYLLQNANSGKCLVVQGRALEAPASQVTCNSAYLDQVWWMSGSPQIGRYTSLANAYSYHCLLVRGFVVGQRATQTTCNPGYIDQAWILLRD
ncbi:MAG TPA: RICIN domain-containing protein [Acidimicrobiales bacterium]|nr:RICIN domain-containing protein [Acidimicrobiales bacterium]